MLSAVVARSGGGVLRRVTPRHLAHRSPMLVFHPSFKCRRLAPSITPALLVPQRRHFHSSRPVHGHPLLPLLIATLKSSASLDFARTIARLALSFMPLLFLSAAKSHKRLIKATAEGEDNSSHLKHLQTHSFLFRVMLALPSLVFFATIFASLERTPLTGRWRMILMSPEEEEEIASQLAGPGWYRAVNDILQQEGNPKLVNPGDWRYQWVKSTLRRLEGAIPVLLREQEVCPDWYLEPSDSSSPYQPPPAKYPLRPRPRASEFLRAMADKMCERHPPPPPPHNINGPPYSLLVVEDPTAQNAFSYGFGPDGAGGIVVYTGFLDDILRRLPSPPTPPSPPSSPSSWWASLLPSTSSSSSYSSARHHTPTAEQTSELAILLAHELSHLILSHHLESVSSAKVLIPGVLSIVTDIIRVTLFPITVLFGPFATDAISNMAKMGTTELEKAGENCNSIAQEIEADQVSVRILAHAGFDPMSAIRFWQDQQRCDLLDSSPGPHDIQSSSAPTSPSLSSTSNPKTNDTPHHLPRWMTGIGHPLSQIRVDYLKREMTRWETERRAKLRQMTQSPEVEMSAINLLTA